MDKRNQFHNYHYLAQLNLIVLDIEHPQLIIQVVQIAENRRKGLDLNVLIVVCKN